MKAHRLVLLLNLLRGWMALTGGTAPTLREICDQLGYPNTPAVLRDLVALRDLGLIDWDPRDETSLRIMPRPTPKIERTAMPRHNKPSQTGASRNLCTGTELDAEIKAGFQAGHSRRRLSADLGRSWAFVSDRLIALGLVDDRVPICRDTEAANQAKRMDKSHVAACLKAGGFRYRARVNGQIVEVRP
jgi:hypothetical protein